MHRSRNVCSEREEGSCYPGGLWDGCCQSHEEGNREKYVFEEALEVDVLFYCKSFYYYKLKTLLWAGELLFMD